MIFYPIILLEVCSCGLLLQFFLSLLKWHPIFICFINDIPKVASISIPERFLQHFQFLNNFQHFGTFNNWNDFLLLDLSSISDTLAGQWSLIPSGKNLTIDVGIEANHSPLVNTQSIFEKILGSLLLSSQVYLFPYWGISTGEQLFTRFWKWITTDQSTGFPPILSSSLRTE